MLGVQCVYSTTIPPELMDHETSIEMLRATIHSIACESSDVNELTPRMIRSEIERRLGPSGPHRSADIKELIFSVFEDTVSRGRQPRSLYKSLTAPL